MSANNYSRPPEITCRQAIRAAGIKLIEISECYKLNPDRAEKLSRELADRIRELVIDARAASMANRKVNAAGD